MQKITIPFSIILGLGRRGSPERKTENVKLKLTRPGIFCLPSEPQWIVFYLLYSKETQSCQWWRPTGIYIIWINHISYCWSFLKQQIIEEDRLSSCLKMRGIYIAWITWIFYLGLIKIFYKIAICHSTELTFRLIPWFIHYN